MSAHMDTAVTVRPRLRCGEAGLHRLLRAPAQSLPDSHSRKNCSMRVNTSFRCSLGNSLESNGAPDSCPQHTTLAVPMDLCSLVVQAYCTNPASERQCPDYFPTTKPPMCPTETVSHWCPCIHFISIGHTLLRPMLDTCYITNINPNLFKSPQCCLPLPFSWDKSPWPLHSLQDLGTETSAILPTWTLPQPPCSTWPLPQGLCTGILSIKAQSHLRSLFSSLASGFSSMTPLWRTPQCHS